MPIEYSVLGPKIAKVSSSAMSLAKGRYVRNSDLTFPSGVKAE